MQQTQTKSHKASKTSYARIVGSVVGLTSVFFMLLSYVPLSMGMSNNNMVAAQSICNPENPAQADNCDACVPENPRQADNCGNCDPEDTSQTDSSCYVLPAQEITDNCPKGDCIIKKYLQPAINLVSAMVGLAVSISIIAAGIRYTTSADNSQKVSEAKQRLVTSVFVLVGYFTFYALMNYLIPGGLL